ncbi:hypothetical protein [Polaribacter tangerinus]|uniref:hypothetical protein n=1 Tax=Polaribacter tangerinus TaxID=1920034 RepID=UPI000B4B1C56|nr:hypothetical protein [Polaribacter tangerinus]
MEEPTLQPLRITAGWNIEWNLFYKVETTEENLCYLDSTSLLHLSNYNLKRAINLEFKPENDVNGQYYLRVINLLENENSNNKYEGDWENLYYEFSSKIREEIVTKIEQLVVQVPPFKATIKK